MPEMQWQCVKLIYCDITETYGSHIVVDAHVSARLDGMVDQSQTLQKYK